ncbi:hypothetical protein TYRP_007082 [Tyrophagus putrescentiae]|nr:hypothetical protein TYRP_007082 [Tyrophagus putrescentiae]
MKLKKAVVLDDQVSEEAIQRVQHRLARERVAGGEAALEGGTEAGEGRLEELLCEVGVVAKGRRLVVRIGQQLQERLERRNVGDVFENVAKELSSIFRVAVVVLLAIISGGGGGGPRSDGFGVECLCLDGDELKDNTSAVVGVRGVFRDEKDLGVLRPPPGQLQLPGGEPCRSEEAVLVVRRPAPVDVHHQALQLAELLLEDGCRPPGGQQPLDDQLQQSQLLLLAAVVGVGQRGQWWLRWNHRMLRSEGERS